MKNFSIRFKLIVIFILIKVIPLLLISYIAYKGAMKLDDYLKSNTALLFNQSKEIILNTANEAITDSVENLDKKSQLALERLSYEIANKVAQFLYQRDEDILFLSKIDINQNILKSFYESKNRDIIIHGDYKYLDSESKWIANKDIKRELRDSYKAILKDNEKEFNLTDPLKLTKKTIPIYKEVVFFDLEGNEKYKISQLNKSLLNISQKSNTYVNSETYFNSLSSLKKGEIYVSDVIGEYVGSKVIGTFTKEKAKKSKIAFEPQNYAYAGKENPIGKKFEGIIRFITPVFKDDKKLGYISLALDHEHIMQFTDTTNPTSMDAKQNIADASTGNYAFMWDAKGRSISHARDYFISGFNKETGKREMPWLSVDLVEKYKESKKEINEFLESYPHFEEQSLDKKPNIEQVLKDGNLGLDCRFLNFAPQCQGWFQVTQNGGYGSFVIYWSKVWKLTTAASIPYFTGQYADSKRGFGFVSIGANVNEFHAAANETKENINRILNTQTEIMREVVKDNEFQIEEFIQSLINELSLVTFIMVILIIVIALWLSNYISKKIESLILGTKKFSENEFSYRIKVHSNDEIGELEKSFNNMASKIEGLINDEKLLNETLEHRVKEEIKKQREQEQLLIQQSKLASMGEMIGNIAHQWRQPLNSISLIIQNIKFAYDIGDLDDEFMERSSNKASMLANDMSKTIDDFRNFFKPNKSKEKFEINKSIDNAIELLSASFEHNEIELEKNYSQENIIINGYINEFSQALLNIMNNAKDALLENKESKKLIKITSEKDDTTCIVKIFNSGKGIDNSIIDKIFNPYFTTKIDSNGTGIGLYMTKTILEENMNGKIKVKNVEGGVEFIIKLPICYE